MKCQFMFAYELRPVFEHLSAIFMQVLMHYIIEYYCQFVFMHKLFSAYTCPPNISPDFVLSMADLHFEPCPCLEIRQAFFPD